MTIRTKGRRLLTCHHEAGHALVRWYFGYDTDRAVVLTVEEVRAGVKVEKRRGGFTECEGAVIGYDILGYPFGPLTMTRSPEVKAECDRLRAVARDIELINSHAGFYAEAYYRRASVGGCMLAGGGEDMKHVDVLLKAWGLHGDARHAACLDAERRAAALVRSPQGNTAIKSMATALMVQGEISGEEISMLCRAAYGGRQCDFGAWGSLWPPTLAQMRAGYIPEHVRAAA